MKKRTIALGLFISALALADPPATRFSGIELTSHLSTVVVSTRYGLWVDSTQRLRYDNGAASHYVLTLASASATGDLFYASAANTVGRLADVGAGAFLRSGGPGAAPMWSTLVLPNAATTGDLLYASSTNTIAPLPDTATGQVLISAGVGVAPAWGTVPNAALPNVGTPGSYTNGLGGAITTDAQGRVSSITTVTRTIATTGLLTGGGDLSANRTLDCPTCVGNGSVSLTLNRIVISNGANAVRDDNALVWNTTGPSLTVSGLFKPLRIAGASATPTAAPGVGAQLGTGPTCTVAGSDLSGNITLTTGTGPTAMTASSFNTLCTVTFNAAYSAAAKTVLIHPMNLAASVAMSGATSVVAYVDSTSITATTFPVRIVSAGAATLPASTALVYGYIVIQ